MPDSCPYYMRLIAGIGSYEYWFTEVGVTELLILLLGVVVIGIAAYVVARRIRARPAPPRSRPARPPTAGRVEVTLPVGDADPESPATQRLVADAAARALAADSEAETVIVLSRGGRELGRVERRARASPRPAVEVPLALHEPHAPRHPGPHLPTESGAGVGATAPARFEDERPQPHRTLAEHFELPDGVRQRIRNAEDPVEIVRAILEEASVPAEIDDNLVRLGDQVLIVLRTPLWDAVGAETLNAAFLRFQDSRAKRGVVVTVGRLHAHEVRRREALAPALQHTGPQGIQRMADAVAMGADPLDFVVQP